MSDIKDEMLADAIRTTIEYSRKLIIFKRVTAVLGFTTIALLIALLGVIYG